MSHVLIIYLLCAGLVGCGGDKKTASGKRQVRTSAELAEDWQAVIEGVVATLNNLPDGVDLELNPPVVVLDSRKSRDGKEILAVCGPNPDRPAGPDNPNNHLWVPRGNAGFRRNGIRPGDVVRYFAKLDQASAQMDIAAFGYFEMPVAQVIDDNRLIVDMGLNAPVDTPTKLQIWRHVDDRTEEIDDAFQLYIRNCVPDLGWEPSPDGVTLHQVVGRLNQWMGQGSRDGDWKPTSLLETLPDTLRGSKALRSLISPNALARLSFEPYEGRWLQEAVWFRDVSLWARGNAVDDLGRATQLFDWTIRNVHLVPEKASDPPREPWEVMLYGRGTAAERASVFVHLCRQQGLDVIILTDRKKEATDQPESETTSGDVVQEAAAESEDAAQPPKSSAPDSSDEDRGSGIGSKPLLAALLSEGELYLFDPKLGLPLPGNDGQGIATLAQARADDGVLRQLDLDESHRYGWSASDLVDVRAHLVSSPLALSRRSVILESQLVSDEAFVLSFDAGAQAARVQEGGQLDDIVLWDHPFRVLRIKRLLPPGPDPKSVVEQVKRHQRSVAVRDFAIFAAKPVLWKARVRHFQGRKKTVVNHQFGGLKNVIDDHKEAMRLYRKMRPPERMLKKLRSPQRRAMLAVGKQHATYWLGLLAFDEGLFDVTEDLLERGTLTAYPNGLWSDGARYNLGRTFEMLGEKDKAIAIYEEEKDGSPRRYGGLIRARRLRE